MRRARRLLSYRLRRSVRRATLAVGVGLTAAPVAADIVAADFTESTTRYGHAVLGDDVEYGALEITSDHNNSSHLTTKLVQKKTTYLVRLPLDHVFEDIAPRLVDVTGDGRPEVIVVETDVVKGAQLAIYGEDGTKLAATPHIGQRNRWLAPIGAADLDGDGHIEVAYIDRPHLAKTLRVWRFKDNELTQVASQTGLTNHRIGEDFISGGIRDCGKGPEMITVNANWSEVMVTRFDGKTLSPRALGPFKNQTSLKRGLDCKAP
ncbi:MAG: VCBS repeat-containing protein [Shimia sp.]|nr:VCBS repeat-containing protein [Shimia sp.]MCP4824111.1 VCBS repeat-containing protein [Shimia sp.]